MEDAGLDPVGGVVLHVLKIDPNDRLIGEEKVKNWALIRLTKGERNQKKRRGSWHSRFLE